MKFRKLEDSSRARSTAVYSLWGPRTRTAHALPTELQHRVYSFLPITDVFIMSGVCTYVCRQIRQSLQKYMWDIVYLKPSLRQQKTVFVLTKLCEAKVNIRTIDVVSFKCSLLSSFLVPVVFRTPPDYYGASNRVIIVFAKS